MAACIYNLLGDLQSIGLGPDSPGSWHQYPSLTPEFQAFMSTAITPFAYYRLYFQPNTFENIFGLISQRFESLTIFRKDGWIFTQLEAKKLRSQYRPIFDAARVMLRRSKEEQHDIRQFVNMSFVFEQQLFLTEGGPTRMEAFSKEEGLSVQQHVLNGFFPYFSNRSDDLGEIMFIFHHAKLKRLALVTVPIDEREEAVHFIRTHGTMHTFDKLCAVCGKTGELLKCPCKRVRYCGAECQRAHWAEHMRVCRGESV